MITKDKNKFVLYLKQKKKDNIKSDMFNVVNKYAIDNTKNIKDIKSRIKEINKINDEIGNSIRDLKRVLLKEEVSRLFYVFVEKITSVKKSPQYKDYEFFMIGDKVCIQHDIKYNTFLIKNSTLFMENYSDFDDICLIDIRDCLKPMFNEYFGYEIKQLNKWFVFSISELEYNLSFCIPNEFKTSIK